MDELYKLIEEKIKASGYPDYINGEIFYNDVSDEVDTKENGTYLMLIKKDDDLFYECGIDILDSDFDLHYADIHKGDTVYHVDFDA